MDIKEIGIAAVFLLMPVAALAAEGDERTNEAPARSLMEAEDPLHDLERIPAKSESTPPVPAPAAPPVGTSVPEKEGTIRIPYIPDTVKQQLREELQKELREQLLEDVTRRARRERWGVSDAWPEWVRRMTWTGDIRLRGQSDDFAADNIKIPFYRDFLRTNDRREESFINTTEDRERLRTRLRIGAETKFGEDTDRDQLDMAFRLATGSSADPVSTNQTLGSTNRPYSIFLDRAFLRYQSASRQWTFWGGRMPNPWFSTDLVWDEDLAFDGLALKFRPFLSDTDDYARFDPFVTLGAFPLQEVELSSKDKWLYGAQTGFNWRFGNFGWAFGLAYYQFDNVAGQANGAGSNDLDFTAPQFVQKGNTMFRINNPLDPARPLFGLASEFREINLTTSFAIYTFAPTQIILTLDYVKNIGFDRNDVLQRTGGDLFYGPLEDQTRGYQAKVTVGRPVVERKGEWQVFGAYKKIERDAVMDAFTDSDFHLGGTDARGWILGGSYGLRHNTWLSVRYISSDEIRNPPLGIDTIQIDLNARF